MAKTVNDVVTEARVLLHDTEAQLYRYATGDLVAYLNNALLEARRIRPDLFAEYLGQEVPSYTAADLSALFPIDDMFFPAFVFYVVGWAEMRDDEFAVDGRAVALMTQFSSKLLMVA